MDPKMEALKTLRSEGRVLYKAYQADPSAANEKALRHKLDLAESLATEIEQDRQVKAVLDREVGGADEEGGSVEPDGLFKTTLGKGNAMRFAKADLEAFQKAVATGGSYRVKAVQAESALGVPAGAALDFQLAPAVRSRFRVADLIPARFLTSTGVDAGNDVTYFRPSVLATGATAVAEAAALPQSSPEWEAVTEPIRKIAHYGHIPDEAIQDWGQFQSVLGNEMIEGLIARENAQLLVGSGVAPNLAGVFDDSRSVTALSQGTDTVIDAIMKALDKVRSLGFVEPDAIIMKSADWTPIRLSKNADDDYYFNPVGGPTGGAVKMIDGVPVYLCEDGTSGHVYVGQFSSLRAYIRKMPSLESTNSADDDFTKDLFKVRVVERFALAVPSSVKFCDLTLA